MKLASRANDRDSAGKAVEEIQLIIDKTNCIPEAAKDKVKNSIEALASFARQRDEEGVRQAAAGLAGDIGVRPVQEKFPTIARGGVGRKYIKGYKIKVDGMPVAEVSKSEMAQAFQATSDLNPNSKVEAEPIVD